jgi:AcrR family transcriptional regulator
VLGAPNVDRQARRREETRREILGAAWEIVRETGWSGLTQRAVAERVGMRAPSLYGHFASKLDIVDSMFGQAWAEMDDAAAEMEAELPEGPRESLLAVGEFWLDAMTSDPERHALMNQRPVPGFTPSEEAYAASVRSIERLHRLFARLGIADPDASDLWTALMAGLSSQQNANDPGGTRWRRLLPRAIDMYADAVGLPPTETRSHR